MTIYYLMIKTHKITGLKYLCQTKRTDPYKYLGSGKHWRLHLRKHGNHIETEIIMECSTIEEIKKWGIHYSNLWNVVESDQWSNLKPEEGDGNSTETAQKMWSDPIWKQNQLSLIKSALNRPDVKIQKKNSITMAWKDQELRDKQSTITKAIGARPEIKSSRSKQATGTKNPKYDHTVYKFEHESGIVEHLTRFEFQTKYNLNHGNLGWVIKGKNKSIKGWRLVV